MKKKIIIIVSFLFLNSCSQLHTSNKNLSEIALSSAGGYLAYQFSDADIFSTIVGSSAGLIVGSFVGNYLSRNDYYYYKNAVLGTLDLNEIGTSKYWKNIKSGNEGVVTIKNYFYSPECRLIEHIYVVGNTSKNFYDTACRENSGSWSIIR